MNNFYNNYLGNTISNNDNNKNILKEEKNHRTTRSEQKNLYNQIKFAPKHNQKLNF